MYEDSVRLGTREESDIGNRVERERDMETRYDREYDRVMFDREIDRVYVSPT